MKLSSIKKDSQQLDKTYTTVDMSTAIAMSSSTFVSGRYNPQSMILNTESPSLCKRVQISIPVDWMKYVIGKAGYYFNAITYQSGCSYIWFHKEEGYIEVWGSTQDSLDDAEERLIKRMDHICIQILTKNGMIKDGKPVKKVMWADIQDD